MRDEIRMPTPNFLHVASYQSHIIHVKYMCIHFLDPNPTIFPLFG